MSNEKKYPLSLTPMYSHGFEFRSITVTPEIVSALSQIETGGKLRMRLLKDEWRKTEKSPNAYLEYLTPAEVAEATAAAKAYKEKASSDSI